jgi:hypothetical protein
MPPNAVFQSVKVKESTVFTRKYCTELTSLSMLSVFEVEIWCYRGGNIVPKWIDRQAGKSTASKAVPILTSGSWV